MNRLWGAMIVRDEFDPWLSFALDSMMKAVDEAVLVVDKPDERTWNAIDKHSGKIHILHHRYAHESKKADGQQRNVYLKWLIEHAVNDYCIVLDTDEVLSDDAYILREAMNECEIGAIRMRHVVWTMGLEDALIAKHYVNNRFFRIRSGLAYQEVEHPILAYKGDWEHDTMFDKPQIWHFSRTRGVWAEIEKLEAQRKKSNIHEPKDLDRWRDWWIFGQAVVKPFSPEELPKAVKERFNV